MKKKTLMIGLIVLFALPALILGCGNLTQKNLDKVKAGMAYAEVVKILGEPTICDSILGGKSCVWKSGQKRIDVQFIADKVVFFSGQNLGG